MVLHLGVPFPGLDTGLFSKHACFENQPTVLEDSGFVLPLMLSFPQKGHVTHFVQSMFQNFSFMCVFCTLPGFIWVQ